MGKKNKVKFKDVIKGDMPVLVDFYATWCGPCKQLSPIVNTIKGELEGKMKVIKVDVDKSKSVSDKYNVRSLPTLAIFQNGKIVWRETGLQTKTQILRAANHFIENPAKPTAAKATVIKSAVAGSIVKETGAIAKKGSWFSRLFN